MKLHLLPAVVCFAVFSWHGPAHAAGESSSLTAYSPDQAHVAIRHGHDRVQYRSASNNAVRGTFYICHAQALAFSANGQLLAVAGGPSGSPAKIKVWRLSDRELLCEIVASGGGALTLAVSSDGQWIAAVTADAGVEVWRITDGQRQCVRAMHWTPSCVRFSEGDKEVVLERGDGLESRFNPADGRLSTAQTKAR
jgi:WD40 repeat protein